VDARTGSSIRRGGAKETVPLSGDSPKKIGVCQDVESNCKKNNVQNRGGGEQGADVSQNRKQSGKLDKRRRWANRKEATGIEPTATEKKDKID